MAEGERFELSVELPPHQFSRLAQSTALSTLQNLIMAIKKIYFISDNEYGLCKISKNIKILFLFLIFLNLLSLSIFTLIH